MFSITLCLSLCPSLSLSLVACSNRQHKQPHAAPTCSCARHIQTCIMPLVFSFEWTFPLIHVQSTMTEAVLHCILLYMHNCINICIYVLCTLYKKKKKKTEQIKKWLKLNLENFHFTARRMPKHGICFWYFYLAGFSTVLECNCRMRVGK